MQREVDDLLMSFKRDYCDNQLKFDLPTRMKTAYFAGAVAYFTRALEKLV
jgi:hypothetical protein